MFKSHAMWWLPLSVIIAQLLRGVLTQEGKLITNGIKATFEGVDLSRSHVLIMSGYGDIGVKVKGDIQGLEDVRCLCLDSLVCVLPSSRNITRTVDLDLDCQGDMTCKVSVSLLESKDYEFQASNENYLKVQFPNSVSTVTLGTRIVGNFSANNGSRLRFFADGRGQLDDPRAYRKSSSLSMEVFHKLDTGNQPLKISRNAVELGSSLMLTLLPSDADYCVTKECRYNITFNSSNAESVLFSVRALPQVREVKINAADSTYDVAVVEDQTYAGTENRYVFHVGTLGDLKFDLEAVEGNPDIYINVDDSLGWDYKQFKYKSERDLVESIMISAGELKSHNLSGKNIYCVIRSVEVTSYFLVAEWKTEQVNPDVTNLRMNAFYSGALKENELTNFILQYKPEVNQVVAAFISLKTRGGNPDLYVKDCENKDYCKFTLEEIESRKKIKISNQTDNTDQPSTYFIYSENKGTDDDLYIALNMVPSGAVEYTELSGNPLPKFPNTYPVSKYNKICIGIVGHSDSLSQLSEYSLIVTGKYTHSVIAPYKVHTTLMGKKDERYYVFNPRNLPDGALGIKINVEISMGDAKVYYSSGIKYPSADANDQEVLVDLDQSKVQSRVHTLKIPLKDLSSDGVYLSVIASKLTLVKIMVAYWLPEPKRGEPINLIPNAPVYRDISKQSDFVLSNKYDMFRFKSFAHKANQKDIFLRIKQDLGMVQACAAMMEKDTDVLTPTDCKFHSGNGMLVIEDVHHTETPTSHDWMVFVEPVRVINAVPISTTAVQYRYEIDLLGPNSVREIQKPGVPVEDYVQDTDGNLHYHDFTMNETSGYFYIVVESLTRAPLTLSVSFLKGLPHLGGYDDELDHTHQTAEDYQTTTLVFTYKEISQYCEIPVASDAPSKDNPKRIVQSSSEQQLLPPDGNPPSDKPLKTISPTVQCRVYMKVKPSYFSDITKVPYRLWFAMKGDPLWITRGKKYSLPQPHETGLEIRVHVDNLPNGVVVNTMADYNELDVSATIVSLDGSTKDPRYTSPKQFVRGYGSHVLSFDSEKFNIQELSTSGRDNYLKIEVKAPPSKYSTSSAYDSYDRFMDTVHFMNILVSDDVIDLRLGDYLTGSSLQGHFQYYFLQVNSSQDVTISLHTKGTQDADLFIQRGKTFPDRQNYFLSSINYRSDEIFIPKTTRPGPDSKIVWYTIGVVGVSRTCEYTIVALADTFKVLSFEFGKILTTQISQQSPLVLRLPSFWDSRVKIFFYSFDGAVEAFIGHESTQGIIKSIPNKTSNIESVVNTDIGVPAVIEINQKKFGIEENYSKKLLAAFYPETLEGSVNLLVHHPNIPIHLQPGKPALRLVLNKTERIYLSLSATGGELEQITIHITGIKENYKLSFDEAKFKLKKTEKRGSKTYCYHFSDNNKKDNEKELQLTLESLVDKNQIFVEVENANGIFKMVPGETHRTAIGSEPGNNTRTYTLELLKNQNLRKMKFELRHFTDSKVGYTMTLQRKESSTAENEIIALDSKTSSIFNGESVNMVDQELPIRYGIYTLTLINNSPNPAIVTFRFILNDMLEIEENGLRMGNLKAGGREDLQLMAVTPGMLEFSLLPCNSTLDVYLSKNKYYSDWNKSDMILSSKPDGTVPKSLNYSTYVSTPTSFYLHVVNQKNTPAEYAIVSKIGKYGSIQDTDKIFRTGGIMNLRSDRDSRSVYVNVSSPAISDMEIKKMYPEVSKISYEVTLYLYLANAGQLEQSHKYLESLKTCLSGLRNSTVLEAKRTILLDFNDLYKGPQELELSFVVDNDAFAQLLNYTNLNVFIKRTVVSMKTTLYLYESGTLEPTATFVQVGKTSEFPGVAIFTTQRGEQIGFFETTLGRLTLILITLVVMVLALFLFYICAAKMSAGYSQVNTPGNKLDGSTALEMSSSHATQYE